MAPSPSQRVIRLTLLVLPSLITLSSLSITVAVALSAQASSIRESTVDRVQEVASSLAELPDVRATVEAASSAGTPEDLADAADLAPATARLQPVAELIARAAGVYYVVITDDEGVRITHPLASQRGVQVATTNRSVLEGTPFLGTETGPSGPALRAKIPVRNDTGAVVGMVAVGVREADIAARRDEALADLLPWGIGALIVGTMASSILTAAVERRFRRLDGLAVEHAQMSRTTAALKEQSHEFTTRLHVIHGLVSRGDTPEALSYIEDVVPVTAPSPAEGTAAGSGDAVRDAAVHAIRADLLDLGAQVEFDLDTRTGFDDELVSVLANLCRNAGEAGATRVRCTLREHGGRLQGAVEDDGPGVDPRLAPRIFLPGYSSKAGPRRSGVGLALVRRILHSRNGMIEVGSSPLGGARFSFEMSGTR
ncbi:MULTISPECIES: sensor histidine kinase [Microbacterium]|uniref:sensor histidine kinase n=1 Tax=Microbacterium TaxID=33882 RepID=UPI0011EB51B5|nr:MULTISPECIES: ATP-binding protein [Microbacterium]